MTYQNPVMKYAILREVYSNTCSRQKKTSNDVTVQFKELKETTAGKKKKKVEETRAEQKHTEKRKKVSVKRVLLVL